MAKWQRWLALVAVVIGLASGGWYLYSHYAFQPTPTQTAPQPVLLSGWQNISDRYVLILESTSTGALGVATSRDSQDDADLEWLFLTPRGTDIRVTRPEMSRTPLDVERHPNRIRMGSASVGFVSRYGKVLSEEVSRSPQGDELLMADKAGQGIWLIDPGKPSEPRQVVGPAEWDRYPLPNPAEGLGRVWASAPAWSPDGQEVYFWTNRDGGPLGEGSVWKLNLETQETSVVLPRGSTDCFWGVLKNGDLVSATPGGWAPARDRLALVIASGRLILYSERQWLEVTGLPDRSTIACCAWSPDGSLLAVIAATIPTPTEPQTSYLLLVSAEGPTPAVSAQVQPPPGLVIEGPVGWLGSSHILVGLSSDTGRGMWAYPIQGE